MDNNQESAFFGADDSLVYEITPMGEIICHSTLLEEAWASIKSDKPFAELVIQFGLSWDRLKRQKRGWIDEQEDDILSDSGDSDSDNED